MGVEGREKILKVARSLNIPLKLRYIGPSPSKKQPMLDPALMLSTQEYSLAPLGWNEWVEQYPKGPNGGFVAVNLPGAPGATAMRLVTDVKGKWVFSHAHLQFDVGGNKDTVAMGVLRTKDYGFDADGFTTGFNWDILRVGSMGSPTARHRSC